MTEGEDYEIQEINNENWSAVKILKPVEFSGVVFKVKTVTPASDPNDDGTYTLAFDYDLVDPKNDKYQENVDFNILVGDIIFDLLEKNLGNLTSEEKPQTKKNEEEELSEIDEFFLNLLSDPGTEGDIH